MSKPRHPVEERFERFVSPEPNTGCWLWLGATVGRGYGVFGVAPKDVRLSHRWLWEQTRGPIPAGMDLCHRCDTPACVNPGHLFVGTRRENVLDMWRKGRAKPSGLKGEAHPRAILSEARVREIRSRRAQGETLKALGLEFGTAMTNIHRICARQTWRSVV